MDAKTKKGLKIAGLVLVGVFVIFTFYFLWKQSSPKPVVYEIVVPQKRNIVKTTVATGDMEARNQVELKPQVNGRVTELRVEAGDNVKEGDIVAIINVIPDMSQLNQALGNVENAKIELEEQQREFDRTENLHKKGVVSNEEYDKAKAKLDESKSKLVTCEAQVDVITKGSSSRSGDVNTTQIKSTLTGTVLNVPVKLGSSVSATSAYSEGTTVAKVADMNDMIFLGNIDETEVAKLSVGMEMTLQPGSMQEVEIPAVLEYIAPEGEEKDGAKMFQIKASAKIPEGITVRSGYSANAKIVLAQADSVLSIDETGVSFEDGVPYIYMLTSDVKDTENQKFERIPVTLGISDGIYIEIKKGIDTDMKIRGIQK